MTSTAQKALFILSELNSDDLEWISQKGKKETLPPDKVLIHEGKKIDALYIILSGTLSVVIESLENRELARLSTGEIVGEISFIDDRPPIATVKVVEQSVVLSIPRYQLIAKLQQDLGFASRFYHGVSLFLSHRMRGTIERLGYGFTVEEVEKEEIAEAQSLPENLALAQAKLKWLLQS